MPEEATPTVLVVDDDQEIITLITRFLRPDYEVVKADSGQAATDLMDGSIDIGLLDRAMPGMTGDTFLDRIRDEGFDCPVALLTAVYPELEISTMAFDDYVLKPVGREDLRSTVESLLDRRLMSDTAREYLATRAKLETLEAVKEPLELQTSDAYRRLEERVRSLEPLALPHLDGTERVP